MAKIGLTRVDYRLVHGQVVVRWSKTVHTDRIVVVDDILCKDEMMMLVYKMAAPKNYKFSLLGTLDFIEKWEKGEFQEETLLVLFQSVESCYRAYEAGMQVESVQLGNCPKESGKTDVCKYIFLNEAEFGLLEKMKEGGVEIYMQNVPDDRELKYSVIEKKMKK